MYIPLRLTESQPRLVYKTPETSLYKYRFQIHIYHIKDTFYHSLCNTHLRIAHAHAHSFFFTYLQEKIKNKLYVNILS